MWAPLQLDSQYVNVGYNTLNHMLAHGSLTLKQRLCLVTVAEHFHHYTLGGSPCVITYNGSTRDFRTRWFVPVAIYCGWGVKLLASRAMIHVTTWEDSDTVMFPSLALQPFSDMEYSNIVIFVTLIKKNPDTGVFYVNVPYLLHWSDMGRISSFITAVFCSYFNLCFCSLYLNLTAFSSDVLCLKGY